MIKTFTLTNGRGEQIELTLNIEGRRVAPKNTQRAHEVTISVVDSSMPVEIETGVRAVYENGEPVNHWTTSGQRIVCTRGDIKRLGTYPVFIYAAGDRSRRGRYALRAIPDVDRFRYPAAD